MIVAGDQEDAAMERRAGGIAMLENIPATIDARSLAVPQGENTVILGAAEGVDLLGSPNCGRGEILVDRRTEMDCVVGDNALSLPERLVEAAQGRAAIARDEASRMKSRARVAPTLDKGQAGERLRPVDIDAAAFESVLVVEADIQQARAHAWFLQRYELRCHAIQRRGPAGDKIGDDARRAMRHCPTDMPWPVS